MKIIRGVQDTARAVTEDEVNRFMESKLNMQLATVDGKGEAHWTIRSQRT